MSWTFQISKESSKFLEKQIPKLQESIKDKLRTLKEYLETGNSIALDLKALKGDWQGFYRIRVGKIRIILTIHTESFLIKIHEINFRGSIY